MILDFVYLSPGRSGYKVVQIFAVSAWIETAYLRSKLCGWVQRYAAAAPAFFKWLHITASFMWGPALGHLSAEWKGMGAGIAIMACHSFSILVLNYLPELFHLTLSRKLGVSNYFYSHFTDSKAFLKLYFFWLQNVSSYFVQELWDAELSQKMC